MSTAIDLPMPPYLKYSEEAELANAPVILRLLDNKVVRGRLLEFSDAKRHAMVSVAPHGTAHAIPFSKIRYMGFIRPSIAIPPGNESSHTLEEDITIINQSQSFQIAYKDGKILKGKACYVHVDRQGIHLYQSKDHRRIHRVFIPLSVVNKYVINPPIEKLPDDPRQIPDANRSFNPDSINAHLHRNVSIVEDIDKLKAILNHTSTTSDVNNLYSIDDDLVVSEKELFDALKIQHQDKKNQLGEILLKSGAIDNNQLDSALKLQQKYPYFKIGKILEKMDAISEAALKKALAIQKEDTRKRLGQILLDMGVVNHEGMQLALAQKFDLPFVRLRKLRIDPSIITMVPEKIALAHNVMPLLLLEQRLVIAMSDPLDSETIDLIKFVSGHNIELVIATRPDIEYAIEKYYQGSSAAEILDELEIINATDDIDGSDIRKDELLSQDKPIVRLVDNIIKDAIHRNASDIHIRPEDPMVQLDFRIDGTLVPVRTFAKHLLPAVIGRIKIIGGMDISERRLPQDGRFRVNFRQSCVDLRISVMPTVQGESVVMRILNTQAGLKSIEQLGFSEKDQFLFTDLLHKSYGILLVTGPTGCGKSTTLYAALQEIKKSRVNMITIEDPVEYRLSGIQQLQVHSSIGFTFARALRNILRHDPDVIMVGEIRDEETGKIAVESALTGHLVLSTLHTNDSAGSITRLMEMGIESYLVRSAVLGILAQRLVRRNCPQCLDVEEFDPDLKKILGVDDSEIFYRGRGCDNCNNTGYKGRLAVYELLPITEPIRKIITEGVSSDLIHNKATEIGMVPLTEQALSQARQKKTSLAEVYRIRLD
ncbi:MAG TPA: GspE/PulE family protein [Gammaproteobacteria bacterium]